MHVDGRGERLDLLPLTRALRHVSAHPLEWDQELWARASGVFGTTRSFLGWALWFAGIEQPPPPPECDSLWLATADAVEALSQFSGAESWDLEVFVHPRARREDLAEAIRWLRLGLPTEALVEEIEERGRSPHAGAVGASAGARDEAGPGAPDEPAGRTDTDRLDGPESWVLEGVLALLDDDVDVPWPRARRPSPVTPDIRLLERALDFAATHPMLWDQGTWQTDGLFGTVRSLAGHALAMSGYVIDPIDPELATSPEGEVRLTWEHAAALLAITEDDARQLFALNDLHRLDRLVHDLGRPAIDGA